MFSIIKIDNCGVLKIQNNYSHRLSLALPVLGSIPENYSCC